MADQYVPWSEMALGRFLLASSALTVVDGLLFYPWDLLKTREHVDRAEVKGMFRASWSQLCDAVRVPDATRKRGYRINPLGLYRGFLTSTGLSLPNYVLYLAIYADVKERLRYDPTDPYSTRTLLAPIAAGAAADVGSLALCVPADVITKRLQLKDSRFTNGMQVVRWIVHTQGVKGLFAGTGATFLSSSLGSMVWWGIYEYTKGVMSRSDANASFASESAAMIGSGALATTVACIATNPVDVVRSRLMVQDPAHRDYRNVFHGLQQIARQEGMMSFTRGILPKLSAKTPFGAFVAFLYEHVFRWSRKPELSQQN